jgi:hypothetical protein
VVLSGPYALLALLLVAAGAAEVVRPQPIVRGLRGLGLPMDKWLVRLGAIGECILGVSALLSSSRPVAVLVAFSFLGFAAFVVAALQRPGRVSSCGCFGAEESPPSPLHLIIDLVLFGFAVAAVVDRPLPLRLFVVRHPAMSVPFLAFVCLAAWFVYLSVTALPQLAAPLGDVESREV